MLKKIENVIGHLICLCGIMAVIIGAAAVDGTPFGYCLCLIVGGFFAAIFGGMLVESATWDL